MSHFKEKRFCFSICVQLFTTSPVVNCEVQKTNFENRLIYSVFHYFYYQRVEAAHSINSLLLQKYENRLDSVVRPHIVAIAIRNLHKTPESIGMLSIRYRDI